MESKAGNQSEPNELLEEEDVLKFLLELNFEVADREAKNLPVIAPGLPPCVTDASEFITDDCVKMPD